ncbi:MAG: ABC transporter transmembrane domain-containing protein [Pseudomonadota bacterium]
MATEDEYDRANQPLETRLMRFIWRQTRGDQLWLLFVIIVSMIPYFMILNLPVKIINEPIQGVGFESATATLTFLNLNFSLPEFLGGFQINIYDGMELERWPYLIALSCSFLALVCVNGLFKFYINTYKGRLGERMLRRMRYNLVDRVLRFPISHFKRVKGSEVASMVKDEVEPFGEFIGDAYVQPVYLGGQALVAFVFILQQSFWLGMIAVSIIAIQMVIIPWLRKRVLELGRQRQLTARLLSGRIGEIVEGITSVHVNDTSNYERSELANRLGKIFFIRYELYQRKFFIKFLNNFLAQLTPFLFYVVGGYFAIRGTLNVGQLIGVINAYKDLPTPINGLIQWDQKRVDIDIKYGQIVEQFNVAGMSDSRLQAATTEKVPPLTGTIEVSNLQVVDDTGSTLLQDADFSLPVDGITAAIGPLGSGAGVMSEALAGLLNPTSGRLRINDHSLTDLPQSVRGRRFAYAGSESYLPQMTLLDTLLYVNKHAPLTDPDYSQLTEPLHPRTELEAKAAGNTLLNYYADWVDYDAMGISGPEEVLPRLREVLDLVEMDEVVTGLAMRQNLDPEETPQLCEKLVEVRHTLRERIEGSPLENLVEVWDRSRYNEHATIAENLVFATASQADELTATAIVKNEYMREVLAKTGLDRDMFEMGIELADTAIDLFADLSPDNPFFEQLNFMTPEELEAYPPVLLRAKEDGFDKLGAAERDMLLQLPMNYIEKRNRLKLLDSDMQNRILEARRMLHDDPPASISDVLTPYDVNRYSPMESVQDNILFGRIAQGVQNAKEQVQEAITDLLREMGLEEEIFSIGLQFDIGTGGKRLSEGQRQRIILARGLLKGADLLIVNRGLNALDQRTQERLVKRVLAKAAYARTHDGGSRKFGLLWVLTAPHMAQHFNKVMVFDRQRLVSYGEPKVLAEEDEFYRGLVS